MLTTGRTGRAVAVVSGGVHDATVIRICEEGAVPEPEPLRDINEVLDDSDFKLDLAKVRLLPIPQRDAIMRYLADGGTFDSEDDDDYEDDDSEYKEVYARAPSAPQRRAVHRGHNLPSKEISKRVASAYREKSKYEYRLDDGKMVVLPAKDTERVFVAGRSGAGKSCFTASYIREYQDMFPDRKVYLFSTHDGEKAYEQLEHAAIILDDGFVEDPPCLDDLKTSLCVFDDCDALQNKKLSTAVAALNADLINNGRKYGITVVTLGHQLMDYTRTRGQLNEANRVVFFPGGSPHHNKRFLDKYAGLHPEWIKKILAEKSRWICMDLRVPNSYVTENAVVIVRSPPTEA